MAFNPQDTRSFGKVSGGADNVQIRVAADGSVYIITDPAAPLAIRKLVAGNAANGDNILAYGSGDGGATPVVLKTNAAGELIVNLGSTPGGTDFTKPGEALAIAAGATALVVSDTPANGITLRLSHVEIHGSGSFYWELREFDGAIETVKARGYTAPGAPHNRISLDRRYALVGDGVKTVRVYAKNIDLTLQADASAELIGNK